MKSKVKIPRGWRRLGDDEVLKIGDAYIADNGGKWEYQHNAKQIGTTAGSTYRNDECPCIRRVTKRKPVKSLGQVVLDAENKWQDNSSGVNNGVRKWENYLAAAVAREVRRRDRMK